MGTLSILVSSKVEDGEEHEEGEISDEEPSPHSVSEEPEEVSSRVEGESAVPPSTDRNPPLLHRRATLDDIIELGSELRSGQTRKRNDFHRGRGELDPNMEGDVNGLKRNGWGSEEKPWQRREFPANGAYGSNLYNFAWAQAVSGRPSFTSADPPTIEASSKQSGDRLLSGSPGLGTWSIENRKLSRDYSRELEFYRRAGRSSEERDDLSPMREDGSRGERGSSERGGRTRDGKWAERPQTVRSRIEIGEREVSDGDDVEFEEIQRRKRRSESQSPDGRIDEAGSAGRSSSEATEQVGRNSEENAEPEDREEGELEEGEIELGSLPADPPPSPSKEPSHLSRQSKYNGNKAVDYWNKDKTYARSAPKSQSRSQVEEYPRRHRQAKSQESQREKRLSSASDLFKNEREKRLSSASDLVKNVTVKDAQKSFVDVCGRLHKALRVLDELHTPRESTQQEGRMESPPREISTLARQAFAGIRAVYAVRNTASGREQERDKNIFPRLLKLANGYCQKLFTPKQICELEVMMRTIANAGRFIRDNAEKGLYPREHQLQSVTEKSKDTDTKQGDNLGNVIGGLKQANNSDPKSNSDSNISGRGVLGFDAKQAEEAAAIAAAALAYAQSSAAARASSLFGSTYGNRSNGTSVSGTGSWGWLSENPSQVPFTEPGLNPLLLHVGYNPTSMGKYQPWIESEQRPIKFGQDGYGGLFVEARAHDTTSAGTAQPEKPKEDLSAPPGYSKPVSSFGLLEEEWEELSPPGAGLSTYVTLTPGSVQTVIGGKDGSSGSKVWPSRLEMGTLPPHQKSRAATSLYSIERLPSPTHDSNRARYSVEQLPSPTHDGNRARYSVDDLPSPTHQKSISTVPQFSPEQLPSRGTGMAYPIERLPSPTPDEDEDPVDAPRLPALESKPILLDSDGAKSSVLMQTQGAGKLSSSNLLAGSVQTLIRSQSLETSFPLMEPKIQKENSMELLLLPSTSRSSDGSEAVKVLYSLPPKGNFRSRDPRRRIQSHSMDMTDMFGMDVSTSVIPVPNPGLGEPQLAGNDLNRKRFASDMIAEQSIPTEKRQKVQSESIVDASEFSRDNLLASSGTGGWLDDNIVPPLATTEEGPIAMDIDEVGPSLSLEDRKAIIIGRDAQVNGEWRADLPDLYSGVGGSKMQKMEQGQQIGENGQRKMKPRDPRRFLLGSNADRVDNSLSDTLRGDDIPAVTANNSSMTATAEVPNGRKIESLQTSTQGASLPSIAPHFMEKLASLVGTVGSNPSPGSASQNQLPVHTGVAQVISGAGSTDLRVSKHSGEVEASQEAGDMVAVPSESISQGLPELQNDKPVTVSMGPRKPKGISSQWGASQVHPGLEQLLEDLSEEERRSVQLERKRRMEEQDRMFSAGKLCLVLDLDHTLLNSAKFSEIEPEWELRLRVAEAAERNRTSRDVLEKRELFRFPHMSMWTKLRPGIWKFLARASQLYELHVYTMGNKVYATEMARLLDPTGKLFAGRVISKGDEGDGDDLLPKSKDLDGVLGMESAVVIVDDSARVWPHHSQNLIVVERYMYFPCSRRQFGLGGPSLLELGHDERESDGMIASALGVIDRIHQSFFKNPRLREVDVREILAAQQRQVLAGCKVVFSRVFPVGEAEPHRHPLWRTAEQFGAICTISIDEQVTHVVAISPGTDKVNWALETGRFVVRPAWLEASTILYRRANEREFLLLPQ